MNPFARHHESAVMIRFPLVFNPVRVAGILFLFLALALGACAGGHEPRVTSQTITDEAGRKMIVYEICEPAGPFFHRRADLACRTSMVPQHYCYRTLGGIDCYERPLPGRTAVHGNQGM